MIRVLAWPIGSPTENNPYVALMYRAFVPPDAHLLAFRPLMRSVPEADVFHLQWPEGIFEGRGGKIALVTAFKAWRVLAAAQRVRRRGGIVALTAHNLAPHEVLGGWRRLLYDQYFSRLVDRVDLLVALTNTSLNQFRARYPALSQTRAIVIPHPHYRESYDWSVSRSDARKMLGLSAGSTITGIIGSIRRSKRVPDAIGLFRRIARDGEELLVSGDCTDGGLWSSIADAAGQDSRVILRRQPLNDQDLATTFRAVDRSLVYQTSTLNSGTVLLALSAGRGVIAPRIGSLPELADHVGEGWLSLVDVSASDAEQRIAFDRAHPASDEPNLSAFSPDRLSRDLLQAFVRTFREGPTSSLEAGCSA